MLSLIVILWPFAKDIFRHRKFLVGSVMAWYGFLYITDLLWKEADKNGANMDDLDYLWGKK